MQLHEVEKITDGTRSGENVAFSSVSIDTRTLSPDALFVAITGVNFDGHDFISEASEKKAAAAVIERRIKACLPAVMVNDTRRALGLLGNYNRKLSSARVLALTGSQGKTTVKEMLSTILKQSASVLWTRGNLNNELGVPLTLLEIDSSHAFAVIEMGANAPGEIAYTTKLAEPDIAHITNAAGTHLEGFGSIDGVARAKGEIWSGLRPGGIAVINLDDKYAELWIEQSASRKVIGISADGNPEADYFITDISLAGAGGSTFILHTPEGEINIELTLLGRHNVANALAAAAMAMEAGSDLEAVSAGLREVKPVAGRMTLKSGPKGSKVIDDSYNASPSSFKAAIDVLCDMPGEHVLVIGDMAELGESAEQAHQELGVYATTRGVNRLFATGSLSALAARSFGGEAIHEDSREALAEKLKEVLQEGVTVLVKGSRSAGMDKLVKSITTEGT